MSRITDLQRRGDEHEEPDCTPIHPSTIAAMVSFRTGRCPLSADAFALLRAGNVGPAVM